MQGLSRSVSSLYKFHVAKSVMSEEKKRIFWERPFVVYAVSLVALALVVFLLIDLSSTVCDLSAAGYLD